jgi:hypothetical protein
VLKERMGHDSSFPLSSCADRHGVVRVLRRRRRQWQERWMAWVAWSPMQPFDAYQVKLLDPRVVTPVPRVPLGVSVQA